MSKRGHQRPKPGQAVCAEPGCGAPLWWIGSGKRPQKCGEHARNPPRYKAGAKLVPVPEASKSKRAIEQRARLRDAERRKSAAVDEWKVMRLALGLGQIPDDPKRAARFAGLGDMDPDELLALVRRASLEQFQDLREARPTAVAAIWNTVVALQGVLAGEEGPMVAPSARATFALMATKVVDAYGGAKSSYSKIVVDDGEVQD